MIVKKISIDRRKIYGIREEKISLESSLTNEIKLPLFLWQTSEKFVRKLEWLIYYIN